MYYYTKIKKECAFSFVEMLVAITLLIFAVGFIMTIFNSNNNEREKVLNYYIAMNIAGKIIEDIDNAIRENPYFLFELKMFDKSYKILEKSSPFYMNIEDFDQNGKLNEEFSDYKDDFDAKKISNYQYKIIVSEVKDYKDMTDFIANVTVSVTWQDGSFKKEYSFSEIFSGFPLVVSMSDDDYAKSLSPKILEQVQIALNSPTSDIKAYANSLNDDYDTLFNMGMVSILVEGAKERLHDIDINIEKVKNTSPKTIYSYVELGQLYEKKSVILMQDLNYMKFPFAVLLKLMKSDKFNASGFAAAAPSSYNKIKQNIGLIRKIDSATNKAITNSFTNIFNDSIKQAFVSYLGLLSEPSIETRLSLRERQSVFLKIIDIGSAMALNKSENFIVTLGSNYQISVKQLIKNGLRNLQLYYEMRNIQRNKYISAILEKFTLGFKMPQEEELEKKFNDINGITKFSEFLYTQL